MSSANKRSILSRATKRNKVKNTNNTKKSSYAEKLTGVVYKEIYRDNFFSVLSGPTYVHIY